MDQTPQLKKVVRVAICIPNEGHTLPEAYDNRLLFCFHLGGLQLASHLGITEYDGKAYDYPRGTEFKFYWESVGRVLTPLARERLTEWALKMEVDYMMMIDDDMMLPMDLFEKLYKHNVDIVAPLAFMRVPPHFPVMFKTVSGWDSQANLEYYITDTVKNYPKDKLVECDGVGFGAVLIKMDVVRRMQPKYFMSTTASGEDIWFCRKAKEVGARVFMDTSVKLGHLGLPPIIEEKDYEREFPVDKLRQTHGEWSKPQEHANGQKLAAS